MHNYDNWAWVTTTDNSGYYFTPQQSISSTATTIVSGYDLAAAAPPMPKPDPDPELTWLRGRIDEITRWAA
jgi:hypothetical protein